MTLPSFETSGNPRHTLCLGGSFNPIHYGHLRCAAAAARERGFPTVLLIPSSQPPHKPGHADLAPAQNRLAMTKLAAEFATDATTRFVVDDLELRRSGPSYTIDTARELRRRGWKEVNWLIGADMLNYLPKWHRADELIGEVNFLILARPGIPLKWEKLPSNFRSKLQNNVVAAPLIDISATDIRRRVREGLSIEDLVPPPVARYIAEHDLYRG